VGTVSATAPEPACPTRRAGAVGGTVTGTRSGTALMGRFVDDILNRRDEASVEQLFSPRYVDHHPFYRERSDAPSGLALSGPGRLADVLALVRLLAAPDVDVTFHLEEAFERDGRVGYRIFGAGVLATAATASTPTHVTYESVGIFAVEAGRFVERWGPVIVSVAA
jgi:hypothetical protein